MSLEQKTRYYHSITDDFVESKDQDYRLPEDYKWVRRDIWSRFLSAVIYAAAMFLSSIYCRFFLHVRFKNKQVLRKTRDSGAFIFGNHTQPIGDVFNPALCSLPKRIYALASPANYGIPVIGKILPYLGALPISDTLHGMKELTAAMEYRLQQNKNIVIYPEAHVWEYYTDIRPFPATSFKFPVRYDKPVYTMTTTYQKRKFGRKPAITIYVDGPFYRDPMLPAKEQAARLRDEVYECMKNRSKNSNYKYICYEPINGSVADMNN